MTASALPLPTPSCDRVSPSLRGPAARRPLPSLAAVLFLACLGLTVIFGSRLISGDGDPARHLLVGDYILRTGTLPLTNVFVHSTPDQPFLPHEWLAEVAGALSHRALGLAGPVLLHGAVAALAVSLVFAHLRLRRVPLLLAVALTLVAAFGAQVHWQVRPHVFSFLGLALLHLLLERFHLSRLSAPRLFCLVPGMLLWANLHGAFVVGLVLVLTYLLADAVRLLAPDGVVRADARRRLPPLAGLAAAGFAATLFNPRGYQLLTSLPEYAGDTLTTQLTQEFQSPDFSRPYARLFLTLLFSLIALLALSPRRASIHDVALAIGFTYLALTAGRNIALFAIAVAPILGPLAASVFALFGERTAGVPALAACGAWIARRNAVYTRLDAAAGNLALPALTLVVLSCLALVQRTNRADPLGIAFDPALVPVEGAAAVERVAAPGEVFNQQSWGGYLALRWWPHRRPFIDGELNAHSNQLLRDYLTVANVEPGWPDILQKYGVRSVLFDTDSQLVRTLAAREDWRVLYGDELATLVVRSETPR